MCDDNTERDNATYLQQQASARNLSRRRFQQIGASAPLLAMLPLVANAKSVTAQDVTINTADGVADAYYVAPSTGQHPAVLIWPDVLGLRPAFRQMSKRLAQSGYAVLVINPYYRQAKAPVVEPGASFADQAVRDIVLPYARSLNGQTTATDTKAFVQYLDSQAGVDSQRKIGTMGYCMGGPMTVMAAATAPARIGAGASFHGGRLVTDQPDSPHRLVKSTKANFLFAIADNDDKSDPAAKEALRASYAAAGLAAEIEVYKGALHGWCVPDSRVYNEASAERAWSRLLHLFANNLV